MKFSALIFIRVEKAVKQHSHVTLKAFNDSGSWRMHLIVTIEQGKMSIWVPCPQQTESLIPHVQKL